MPIAVEPPVRIRVAKQYKRVAIIEGDLGYSVVMDITHSRLGRLGWTMVGGLVNDPAINENAEDSMLELEDAEHLAEAAEAAFAKQEGQKRK